MLVFTLFHDNIKYHQYFRVPAPLGVPPGANRHMHELVLIHAYIFHRYRAGVLYLCIFVVA